LKTHESYASDAGHRGLRRLIINPTELYFSIDDTSHRCSLTAQQGGQTIVRTIKFLQISPQYSAPRHRLLFSSSCRKWDRHRKLSFLLFLNICMFQKSLSKLVDPQRKTGLVAHHPIQLSTGRKKRQVPRYFPLLNQLHRHHHGDIASLLLRADQENRSEKLAGRRTAGRERCVRRATKATKPKAWTACAGVLVFSPRTCSEGAANSQIFRCMRPPGSAPFIKVERDTKSWLEIDVKSVKRYPE